jgi:hypothetical protein
LIEEQADNEVRSTVGLSKLRTTNSPNERVERAYDPSWQPLLPSSLGNARSHRKGRHWTARLAQRYPDDREGEIFMRSRFWPPPIRSTRPTEPARRRDANRGGIEQQQIGMRADRDGAAIGDAVKPGLMARQTAHAFREVERAAFAHPIAKEIKPQARIAQIDQMCAGIRKVSIRRRPRWSGCQASTAWVWRSFQYQGRSSCSWEAG